MVKHSEDITEDQSHKHNLMKHSMTTHCKTGYKLYQCWDLLQAFFRALPESHNYSEKGIGCPDTNQTDTESVQCLEYIILPWDFHGENNHIPVIKRVIWSTYNASVLHQKQS